MFVQEVLLRLPLKTSPNDPFPIRSCFSNRTSGSPLDMVICVCKLIEWLVFSSFFLGIELDTTTIFCRLKLQRRKYLYKADGRKIKQYRTYSIVLSVSS